MRTQWSTVVKKRILFMHSQLRSGRGIRHLLRNHENQNY